MTVPQARGAESMRSALRSEIDSLYAEHNPTKLADVDDLVAKYGEAKLLAMVRLDGKPLVAPILQVAVLNREPRGTAAGGDRDDLLARRELEDPGNAIGDQADVHARGQLPDDHPLGSKKWCTQKR